MTLPREQRTKKYYFWKGEKIMIPKHSKAVWLVSAVIVLLAGNVYASPYFAIGRDQWQDALDDEITFSATRNHR